MYTCFECKQEITILDSVRGELMTINVDGHAKAVHRVCPESDRFK